MSLSPKTPDYEHVPAAFINAIAEEGTKAEAIEYLQKTWNECCALRRELALSQPLYSRRQLEEKLATARKALEGLLEANQEYTVSLFNRDARNRAIAKQEIAERNARAYLAHLGEQA